MPVHRGYFCCGHLTSWVSEPRLLPVKKTCIQIVLFNITYAVRRFDARDERSIHGGSPYHGGSWLFSRQGIPFGNSRRKRECRPHICEEISFKTLQGRSDRHHAR